MFPRAVYPLTPAQLQAAVAERRESTVILCGEKVVGFANFYTCQPADLCAIGNVIVAPSARRQGSGRALVEEMLRKAFEIYSAKAVEICCFNQNTAGLLFYPKLGFTPASVEERVDWAGEKAALIHFRLPREAWQNRQEAQSASSR